MTNGPSVAFVATQLRPERITGRRVLDVGSFKSPLREWFQSFEPAEYVGVDIFAGPSVSRVCPIERLEATFGRDSFDVVAATEVVEHIEDWRGGISNMKRVCRPHGSLVLTTRSKGFFFHPQPDDCWRYEPSDMRTIFSDMDVRAVASDPLDPGVFVHAVKPEGFRERDLSQVPLYSIKTGRVQLGASNDGRIWTRLRTGSGRMLRILQTTMPYLK